MTVHPNSTVVGVPTWLMSVVVAFIMSASGGGAWLGVEMYAAINTLTDRVNRISDHQYMTRDQFNDRIDSRDREIKDLYARYRDLRHQMRYYHGQRDNASAWTVPNTPPDPPRYLARMSAIHDKRWGG